MSFIKGKGDVRLVLFITVDCLRNDYFLRFARFATSFFSRSGNLFANVYTHGVGTPAAFPAILTSTYPLMFSAYPGVGSTRQSLAEVFRSLGFYTVGLVPNPYLSTYYGYNRGFNLYFDYLPTKLIERVTLYVKSRQFVDISVSKLSQMLTPYVKGFLLVGLAKYILKKLLTDKSTRKVFMWIHYMDVHAPLAPSQGITLREYFYSIFAPAGDRLLNRNAITQLYTRAVTEIDSYFKVLIEFLEDLKLLENTVVVFTSDHGEELLEDGVYGHPPIHSEHTLHVPLGVYPRVVDSRAVINSLKGLIDLAPSLLDLLGFGNVLRQLPWYGEPSLFSEVGRDFIIAETGHTSKSNEIKDEHLKYSIITSDRILTYKPFDKIIIIRNKYNNKIENVCRESCPAEINRYISLIQRHMKLEAESRLIERIKRVKQKIANRLNVA